jgi:multidrug efflux pump
VTRSAAIFVSMLVSLTTTPMMCALLLRSHDEERHGRLYGASERAFEWVLARYAAVLRWVLAHQPITLGAALAAMAATVYLYVIIPKGFFPQQDVGRMNGTLIADQDTSFQAMQRRVVQFADVVRQDPAVDGVIAYAGGGGLGGGSAVNTARVNVNLKNLDVRKLAVDQVMASLRGIGTPA